MRSSLPSTTAGGFVCVTSSTKRGDRSGRLESFHRRRSRKPRTCDAPGLKKRFPSKCFGNGGVSSSIWEQGLASFHKLSTYDFRNHRPHGHHPFLGMSGWERLCPRFDHLRPDEKQVPPHSSTVS